MSSPVPPDRTFRRLALVVAGATLLLVGAGGLVRATGSGLGCLDEWPTCRGGWIAPIQKAAMIEWTHRLLAATVVALVVAQAVLARVRRRSPAVQAAAYAAAGVIVAQAAVGGLVVFANLHAAVVTVHFVLATALVAATTGVAVASASSGPSAPSRAGRLAAVAAGATFVVLLAGTFVRERGAGLAFGDWPLMDGRLLPGLSTAPNVLQFVHRAVAAIAVATVIAAWTAARRDDRRPVRRLANAVVLLYAAQALVGAANVFTRLAPAAVLAHVTLGAATWSAVVALAVASRRAWTSDPKRGSVIGAYAQLTKPRIVVLLLITTVPTMILARRGLPSFWLVAATLLGGTLTAGGANAINQYLDRDIDEKMRRTRSRPLPSNRIQPARALWFGVTLAVVGSVWLLLVVNWLSSVLAAGAVLFYVFVYTIALKRSTAQNIVIGGAAGAVPVLVGWAAVTGTLSLPAWILFAVIFFWTPPHFWALALRYREDYAAAGVPMLPVVAGERRTTRQILVYTVELVAVTLLLYPAAGMGVVYVTAAAALGVPFVALAISLHRGPSTRAAMRVFAFSINYLGLLFAAVALDVLMLG